MSTPSVNDKVQLDAPTLQYLLNVDIASERSDFMDAFLLGKLGSMEAHRKIQFALRQNGVGDLFLDNVSRIIILSDETQGSQESKTKGSQGPDVISDLTQYAVAISRWVVRRGHAQCAPFLCSYHKQRAIDHGAEQRHLVGLLRSLCYLILATDVMATATYTLPAHKAQTSQSGHHRYLLSLLSLLVRNLLNSGRSLVCVIDSLHLLEREDSGEFWELMGVLIRIVLEAQKADSGSSVKIVLLWPTSWSASLYTGCVKVRISEEMIRTNEVKLDDDMTIRTQDIDDILTRRI